MHRKRSSCLCGYEGRVDKVNEHKKRCRGLSVIKELIEENKKLKIINADANEKIYEMREDIKKPDEKIVEYTKNIEDIKKREEKIVQDTKNIEDMRKQDTSGFAYIIREREFLRMNENVFKVGKCEDIVKRFKNYPNGSELVKYYKTSDRHAFEKLFLMDLKNSNAVHRKDIGNEYFEADVGVILGIFENLVKKELK